MVCERNENIQKKLYPDQKKIFNAFCTENHLKDRISL